MCADDQFDQRLDGVHATSDSRALIVAKCHTNRAYRHMIPFHRSRLSVSVLFKSCIACDLTLPRRQFHSSGCVCLVLSNERADGYALDASCALVFALMRVRLPISPLGRYLRRHNAHSHEMTMLTSLWDLWTRRPFLRYKSIHPSGSLITF